MLGQNQIETAGETDKPPLCRHQYSWVHPALELRRSINGWGLFVKERYQFNLLPSFLIKIPPFAMKCEIPSLYIRPNFFDQHQTELPISLASSPSSVPLAIFIDFHYLSIYHNCIFFKLRGLGNNCDRVVSQPQIP
jgi:hypothetical protein